MLILSEDIARQPYNAPTDYIRRCVAASGGVARRALAAARHNKSSRLCS